MKKVRFGSLVERIDHRAGASKAHLPLLSVSQTRGVVRFSDLHDRPPRADSFEQYKVTLPGDIAFNKMSIRSGAMGAVHEEGLVTYHYEILRPRLAADTRFILHLMKSSAFTAELIKNERGIGAGGAGGVRTTEVPYTVLRNFPVPAFSPTERLAIADYLDHETAEIDALIADLNELDALTAERCSNEREQLFAAHRDNRLALRRLGLTIRTGVSVNASPYPAPSGTPGVLKTGAVSRGFFEPEENKAVQDPIEVRRLTCPVRGDTLIVNRANTPDLVGSAAYVSGDQPHLFLSDLLWEVTAERASHEFIAQWMQTHDYREQISLIRTGASSSMQKIAKERFMQLVAPIPDSGVQLEIAERASAIAAGLRSSSAEITRAIALAKKRRAALITAAVTGQIDVTAKNRPAAEQLEDDIKELS